MAYTCDLAVLPPLPFRRGEGRGEGSVCVVYPTASPVSPSQTAAACSPALFHAQCVEIR